MILQQESIQVERSAVWHTVPETNVVQNSLDEMWSFLLFFKKSLIKLWCSPGYVFIHNGIEAVVEVAAGELEAQ